MKMKKMLAILAALSVLGTTGLTVGAEDTVTTTEPATEAITTTETEAETTAAETEEITETTTEEVKAVEDSNREGKIYATKEYTMGSHVVKVVLYDDGTLDSSENPVECMSVYVDGNLTNLSGVVVNTAMNGDGSNTSIQDPDSFLTVTGTDAILVTPYSLYGGSVAYTYDAATNTFVPADTASTTTATTEDETTTTTTTTKKEDAQPVTGDFQLDGVTLTPKIETKGQMGDNDGGLFLNIYSADETLLLSIRVALFNGGTGRPEGYYEVSRYLVKTGFNTIVVNDYSDFDIKKYHSYVFENGKFVSTGTTTDDNQEKTFTVEIPYAYFTVIDSVTGEVVTTPGANKSMVNAAVTSCTNGNVASLNYGNEADNSSLDAFLQSITVSDVKPGTLTIKGTCQSYSSLTPEEKAAGYTTLPHCGDAIENYFTLTVTIDENGNIVTGGSNNENSGKTDNGSASNAPASTATKNTSGTPKTGDTTTVPAVAVGLTLTAAGVVAFISKRKK